MKPVHTVREADSEVVCQHEMIHAQVLVGLMRAQVVYRQGLVKDFICPDEFTLREFVQRVSVFGKVRVLRSLRVVKDLSVELIPANNVTVLR